MLLPVLMRKGVGLQPIRVTNAQYLTYIIASLTAMLMGNYPRLICRRRGSLRIGKSKHDMSTNVDSSIKLGDAIPFHAAPLFFWKEDENLLIKFSWPKRNRFSFCYQLGLQYFSTLHSYIWNNFFFFNKVLAEAHTFKFEKSLVMF